MPYHHMNMSAVTQRRVGAFQGLLLSGTIVIAAVLVAPRSVLSQSAHKDHVGSLLPATVGEPLTIKPLDMADIDCVVAEWRPTAMRPVLTLICPPSTVFAPLRVLIKLSWMKSEDVSVEPEQILAPEGSPTKIRTNKTAAQVWLHVNEKGERKPRSTWVGFTAVVDVALLSGHPK